MHPLLLLVAAAWLLPASLGRGLRVSSPPTSVQEQKPPMRHDIPHLRQGPRPKNCQNSQCFNYDLFDCFHRTSAECNKDNYNIANPGEFPQFKSPAPTVTPPTKRPTVTKPVVLERSNHPIIVSLGRLPSGWQKAHPALMDQVKMSVRLFALQSLMNCKAGWDVPAEITGVTIVPGRIPGRLDSVLFSVQISAEIRGFADVIQGYVETCMEMGKGSLIQRLKALDPNVFANLSIITGSFDPLDVNNNPTLRPTDSVQQIEVAETIPPSPVVVAAIPSIPSVPAIPAPQFGEGKERDEGVEGGEGDDEGEDEGEGGGSLLAENMWLIGLAASSILLVFPCVMISRRAKKKREAAKVEAKKTAMMMNQLKSAGAPGGASGGSPDPLTQNVLDSLFGMSGNTASTGVSSASRPTPEPSASAGAIAALDSLIAVSAASKPSKPYAPPAKPPLASAPKNQLNQGYVPTRRNPSHPHASNSRPVKANKRKNEAVGKKKPTRAELIAAQEEMWAKRAAAGQSASKLKATPKLQRSKSASKLKATPKLQRSKEIVRSKSQRRSSKEIVPFQPNSHQQSSKEIVPYRPSPQQQRQQRHHAAHSSGQAPGARRERKPRRYTHPDAKGQERLSRSANFGMNHSGSNLRREEERKRLSRSANLGMNNSGFNPKSMPRIDEDNRRMRSLNHSKSTSKIAEQRRLRKIT